MANRITVTVDRWALEDDDPGRFNDTYDGDMDATVSPNGELLIIENKKLTDDKEIKAIYSRGSWDKVTIE